MTECVLSQRSSVDKQEVYCEGNTCSADPDIFNRHSLTKPGVDTQHYPSADVSSNTLPDLLGESRVQRHLASPEFTPSLTSFGSNTSCVCRINTSLEGDQILKDCLGCDCVQSLTLCSNQVGVTDKSFEEGVEELIQKKQKIIIPDAKPSPDAKQEQQIEDTEQNVLTKTRDITEHSKDLVNFTSLPLDHFVISENNCVAYLTLDINDPFTTGAATPIFTPTELEELELKMPHKTHKNTVEGKTHSIKEKSGGHHHSVQASKKQESISHRDSTQQTCKQQENHPTNGETISERCGSEIQVKDTKIVIETIGTEKKQHGKKKKKHGQDVSARSEGETSADAENGVKPKTTMLRVDMFEAKLGARTGKALKDSNQSVSTDKKSNQSQDKTPQEEPQCHTDHKTLQTKTYSCPPNEDVIKRRRMSGDKFGKIDSSLESKLPKTDASMKAKEEETQRNVGAAHKKAYSEVVKQKTPPKKGEENHQTVIRAVGFHTVCHHKYCILFSVEPKVVQPIQAVSVSGDPQSLCLWCQFVGVPSDYTVTWSREGTILSESKRRYSLSLYRIHTVLSKLTFYQHILKEIYQFNTHNHSKMTRSLVLLT